MSEEQADAGGIVVRVNSNELHVRAGTTVRQIVEQLGLGNQAVAAELNGALVPRRAQSERVLQIGDVLELVSLVGGG